MVSSCSGYRRSSLGHLSFPQVIGAYVVTGIIITIIGITGIARTSMDFIPLPIIMGMIAEFSSFWLEACFHI